MINDAYTLIGKNNPVSSKDAANNYLDIHDNDRDGKVTIKDIEKTCIKYLCNSGGTPINLSMISRIKNDQINTSHPKAKSSYNREDRYTSLSPNRENRESSHGRTSKKTLLIRQLTDELGHETVQQELKHAKTIFEKYDVDKDGYLDHSEVEPMMKDTYKNLGQYFNPSRDDVSHYISMMDVEGNDRVSQEEYETFVLRALAKRHIKL